MMTFKCLNVFIDSKIDSYSFQSTKNGTLSGMVKINLLINSQRN